MMELNFLKGTAENYAALSTKDANSFYVVNPDDQGTIALYLGDKLIASGNTVAALVAEIQRAKDAEKGLSDRLDALAGNGEGSVVDQIAKALQTATAYTDAREVEIKKYVDGEIDKLETAIEGFEVKKLTEDEVTALGEANVKEAYKLVDAEGVAQGEVIKVYKDSSLKQVELSGQNLVFTYILASGAEDVVSVDVSSFLSESEYGDGLKVVDHVISVKRDEASEAFLTVGADGVKLAGVQDAIDAAEADAKAYTDEVVSGLDATVTANTAHINVEISEVDGKLTEVKVVETDIATKSVVEAAISAETDARTSADTALQNAINDLSGVVSGNQSSIESALETAISDLVNGASEGYQTLKDLEDKIKAEADRAVSAETALNNAITAETSARETAINGVNVALSAETSERKAADEALNNAITALTETVNNNNANNATALTAAINALDADVSGKSADEHVEVRVIEVDGKLTQVVVNTSDIASATGVAESIKTEKERAESAETALQTAIDNEISARTAADEALQNAIDTEKGRLDAFLKDADMTEKAIDTLAELQKYIEDHGSEAADMMTGITANAKAISDEKARAESAETALQTAIDNEISARTAADNTITGQMAADKAELEGKINAAKAAATTVVAEGTDEGEHLSIVPSVSEAGATTYTINLTDVASASGLSKEISDRETAISGVNDAIEAEHDRAVSAETDLQTAIDNEASARTAADSTLSGRLDVLEGVTVTGKDAIVVSANDAKTSKEVSLKLGTQPADDAAGVVLAQDTNGLTAKLQWGTF